MDGKNYKAEIIQDKRTKFEFFVKVVVAGDCEVGKTAILKQLLKKEFISEYKPTKGYEFNIVLIKVNDTVIKFQIWDMCGAENYRISLLQLYRNANLGILVYSITSRESFDNLKNWIIKLRDKAPLSKIILIGNKCDLEDQRKVSFEEGKEMCEKYELEYFMEISAKREINNNFMEIAAISLFKDYETNGNEMSLGVLNESVMLNDYSKRERIKRCC
jgi:small GTP-binding protein